MSSRSSGRHRKSRMSSRRTLTVVTGAAGVVVAVTTGDVPVTLVPPDRPATPAPGQGRSSDPSSSPAPSDEGPVPTVPLPLSSATSSFPGLPTPPLLP